MRKIFTAFMMMLCVACVASAANYLTFTAEEDGSTFGVAHKSEKNPDIQYSLDGGETWTALAAGDTITLAHKGDKALLRGDNPEGISKGYSECSSFTMTGRSSKLSKISVLQAFTGNSAAGYGLMPIWRNCCRLSRLPISCSLSSKTFIFFFNYIISVQRYE